MGNSAAAGRVGSTVSLHRGPVADSADYSSAIKAARERQHDWPNPD